jgi:hypothetical protein
MYVAYLRVGETYGYEIMTRRRAIVLPVMHPNEPVWMVPGTVSLDE